MTRNGVREYDEKKNLIIHLHDTAAVAKNGCFM